MAAMNSRYIMSKMKQPRSSIVPASIAVRYSEVCAACATCTNNVFHIVSYTIVSNPHTHIKLNNLLLQILYVIICVDCCGSSDYILVRSLCKYTTLKLRYRYLYPYTFGIQAYIRELVHNGFY